MENFFNNALMQFTSFFFVDTMINKKNVRFIS